MDYPTVFDAAMSAPEAFWRDRAAELDWFEFPPTILDQDDNGAYRWFRGGKLNTSWLALDRHVENGRGDDTALIYDSPVTDTKTRFSFRELADWVAKVAGALQNLGVEKGDRVIIYMPMVPEAVVSMLACARIGAIHSVVFGGFAAPELAVRIDDAKPKVIICASCGIEFQTVIPYKPLIDGARSLASHKIDHCVVLQREQCQAEMGETDVDWAAWEAAANPVAPVALDACDPLYILYTSGTTGKPKGVLRDNGGHAVALNYSMRSIYDCGPGDVYWAASDVGWVVGHSYIVYGPLLAGCTTILYEGKPVRTPDAGALWRVISEYRVKCFFTAPTAFRAVKKEDPEALRKANYDMTSLATVFVAGERLDPPTYEWLGEHLGVPIIDHWWQTETGWSICAKMMGLDDAVSIETRAGSPTFPVPGYDLKILDEDGNELGPDQEGNVVVAEPLPPGALVTIWGDHGRYVDAYFSAYPNHYLTGDGGYRDADGYVYIMGRVDDVMNVAGHRLSTGELEEVVASHPAVAECAVIGIADEDKGQIPLGLLALKDGVNEDPLELERALVAMVRADVGAFANFKRAVIVSRLPKTRSGKILRQVIRKLVDGVPYDVPSTIDDPVILDELEAKLKQEGVITAR